MAGTFTTDGKIVAANLVFKHVDGNRGTTLNLGLFTNASGLTAASVLADITVPTGDSYAPISLADGTWSISNAGVASYSAQTFTATVAITGSVYGYYLSTTGTTPKLLAYELYGSAITFLTGDTYTVTPNITVG